MGSRCSSCFRSRHRHPRPTDGGDRKPYVDLSALAVQRIDLLVEENSMRHKTDKYEITKRFKHPQLVVRRGWPFRVRLYFHRPYRKEEHIINFVFTVKDVKKANYAENTEIIIPVSDESINSIFLTTLANMENSWMANLVDVDRNTVVVEVISSSSAMVSEWTLQVDVKSKGRNNNIIVNKFITDESIYVLFNPWSKMDLCYHNSKSGRDEYVLNESGIIWRGTANLMRPTPWNYGQFQNDILECSIFLLTSVGKLSVSDRSDPVKVVRHLSQVVNDSDDDGVIRGNWTGNYSGGRAPSFWSGSMLVLQEYYRTKRPVKYGQCWVYAGVLTSVCRCLGIPARIVSNYYSAHDTHNSLTVDRIFDESGEPIDDENSDSIWNFHAWTEVWMARTDLSLTGVYDGWQVIDSTPQEPSDGLYRVGPTSVEAVRRGEVLKPYDGKFVFAEVNADEVFWLKKSEDVFKLIDSKTDAIGVNISTKSVGSTRREDITLNYKEKEHTRKERQVMLKALRLCKDLFARLYLNEKFDDLKFELVLLDDIIIGQSFTVRLKVKNESAKVYTIESVIGVRTTLYTGVTHRMVKKERKLTKIAPFAEQEIRVTVSYEEYDKNLIDQNSFIISVLANVIETDYQFFATDDFRVRMPDIKIEIDDDIIQGRPFRCFAYFVNPLPKTLTKAYFTVEGAGLGTPLKLRISDVRPKAEAHVAFTMTSKHSGEKTIIVKFMSNELHDVDGYRNIRVAAFLRNTSL